MRKILVAVLLGLMSVQAQAAITWYDWTGEVQNSNWRNAGAGTIVHGSFAIEEEGSFDHGTDISASYNALKNVTLQVDDATFKDLNTYTWTVVNSDDYGHKQGFSDDPMTADDPYIISADLSMQVTGDVNSTNISEASRLDTGDYSQKGWGIEIREKIGQALYASSTYVGGVITNIVKRSDPDANFLLASSKNGHWDSCDGQHCGCR